ncbi:carboxy terminal-processing peptidase [Olivibacter sp. SDN3]|uniref:carboxy terminal-processing peptidase n=1 Tax=Olivibacter sp. SDN3 TaxID=2764720 RepID=UPI00165158AA|nr:carboxy terminal-processing peptidase [Olivibacter sp. SDN3]QNL51173.1 carboxy terminal-processing peptidase [Olivibacter sp. SDN3]
MLKKLFLALFIVAAVACSANPRVNLEEGAGVLKPNAKQEIIAKDLVNLLEKAHYKKVPFNDSLSSVVFDRLLSGLDPSKNYFLQSDIDSFESYRKVLLNDLRSGDLSAMFQVFNVYRKRFNERLNYAVNQVDSDFDFSKDESFDYDREKLGWFEDEEEANESWRKRVKYDLLKLRLSSTGKEDEEAKNRKTLKERYGNLISQEKTSNSFDAFEMMMNAFTGAIDPHTNYFTPEGAQAFNESMSRSFEGIGAQLMMDNEVVRVMRVVPGGPAFRDKSLKQDDRIIAVAQGDEEFVDVIGWRLGNVVSKIKGPKGTTVRLKVIPAGEELTATPKVISLIRDKIVDEEQSARKEIKEIKGDDGKTYKIGVIKVPGFYLNFKEMQAGNPDYKSTTRDVKRILDTLKQEEVDGVLMDLRANGGGSLIEAVELTGLFIKSGPVVQVRDPNNRVEVNRDDDETISWEGPLGVMIDRFSASASEIFAAAIQDYGRGVILGTQSYGKGTVQSAVAMDQFISRADRLLLSARTKSDSNIDESMPQGAPTFGQINFTTFKFYRVNGSSTQHKGVTPDIEFPMIYTADKFGESSEKAALPWDHIKSSTYNQYADLVAINQTLKDRHDERMKTSAEYKYLLEDIELFRKREGETSITLQEDKLKEERDEQDIRNRARVNARRKLRGLPEIKKGEPLPRSENDFIQEESLNVMADFISAKQES